jgi:hypothetical protein
MTDATATPTRPAYAETVEYWTSALAAAEDAIASPRPDRRDYTGGEYGYDQYMADLEAWEARQRVAYRLKHLAQRRIAALA